jgi:uroporphyrinogen-III synthase
VIEFRAPRVELASASAELRREVQSMGAEVINLEAERERRPQNEKNSEAAVWAFANQAAATFEAEQAVLAFAQKASEQFEQQMATKALAEKSSRSVAGLSGLPTRRGLNNDINNDAPVRSNDGQDHGM